MLACTCNSDGKLNDNCDPVTGQCTCKSPTIVGHECVECEDNYYGFPICGGTNKYIYFLIHITNTS